MGGTRGMSSLKSAKLTSSKKGQFFKCVSVSIRSCMTFLCGLCGPCAHGVLDEY